MLKIWFWGFVVPVPPYSPMNSFCQRIFISKNFSLCRTFGSALNSRLENKVYISLLSSVLLLLYAVIIMLSLTIVSLLIFFVFVKWFSCT